MPLQHPGVVVRPIQQMNGGASFNEVFFSDAVLPDEYRVGAVGEGWKVALTVLGHERNSSGGSGRRGGDFVDLVGSQGHCFGATRIGVRQRWALVRVTVRAPTRGLAAPALEHRQGAFLSTEESPRVGMGCIVTSACSCLSLRTRSPQRSARVVDPLPAQPFQPLTATQHQPQPAPYKGAAPDWIGERGAPNFRVMDINQCHDTRATDSSSPFRRASSCDQE